MEILDTEKGKIAINTYARYSQVIAYTSKEYVSSHEL